MSSLARVPLKILTCIRQIMEIRDGPEQRENLLHAHHRLLDRLGQRHGHIFSRILHQKLLLSGQMSDGADVGKTASNHRLDGLDL